MQYLKQSLKWQQCSFHLTNLHPQMLTVFMIWSYRCQYMEIIKSAMIN